jgi:hypothetical protein
MLDIELPDFPRGDIEETVSPNWDMFGANFADCGFRKLETDEPLQANDVILMCIVGDRTHLETPSLRTGIYASSAF